MHTMIMYVTGEPGVGKTTLVSGYDNIYHPESMTDLFLKQTVSQDGVVVFDNIRQSGLNRVLNMIEQYGKDTTRYILVGVFIL